MGKTSLRVMSINVENLFSPGHSFYGAQYTPEEYKAKIGWIGFMLGQIQVHVVALAEIGEDSETCIRDIMQAANANDMTDWPPFNFEFRAQSSKGSTKIRSAIVSRFPLADTESIVEYPAGFQVDLHKPGTSANNPDNWVVVPSSEFNRPVAKARVVPADGTAFNLFVLHLKSKRPVQSQHDGYNEAVGIARSAVQRNTEAAALRVYLDQFLPAQYDSDPQIPTIIAGDFNDDPASVPVENIRGPFDTVPGPSSPWSQVDKRRLIGCARLHLKKSAYEDKLFSYVHNENFTLIDHLFVSEHLPSKFVRFEIYNDHVFRHHDLSAPTDQEKQWKSMVSDHGIIVVEFNRML